MISKLARQPQTTTAGFSLVETLVALSILLIATVAPLTIASKSLQNVYFARENITAVMLAQEGVEAVVQLHRNSQLEVIKDGADNWQWFDDLDSDCKNSGGAGCAFEFEDSAANTASYEGTCNPSSSADPCIIYLDPNNNRAKYSHQSTGNPEDTPYRRSVRVWDVGDGNYSQVMVESEVTWNTPIFTGEQSVIARTMLFDVATSTI